jgi:hypothetical protein
MRAPIILAAAAVTGLVFATSASADPPGITTFPTITQNHHELIGNPGVWTGDPTFTYLWGRCSASLCTDIPDTAGQTTYRLTKADVGFRVFFAVTGDNPDGSTSTAATTGFFTKGCLNGKENCL